MAVLEGLTERNRCSSPPDLTKPREEVDLEKLQLELELSFPNMPSEDKYFLPEVQLCRYAARNSDATCIEVLLSAGCRSLWIGRMATLEGRASHLAITAARGAAPSYGSRLGQRGGQQRGQTLSSNFAVRDLR